jgi:hypothetical protein
MGQAGQMGQRANPERDGNGERPRVLIPARGHQTAEESYPVTRPAKGTKPARTTQPEKVAVSAPKPEKPEPSAAEREAIKRAQARRQDRLRRLTLQTDKREGRTSSIGAPHSDHAGWITRL